MTAKLLNEAASVSGGSFSLLEETTEQPFVYRDGEFRVACKNKTLVVTGLDESKEALVRLVAALACCEDEGEESVRVMSLILDPDISPDQARIEAARAGIGDAKRTLFFVESERSVAEVVASDAVREIFLDKEHDMVCPLDDRHFCIVKNVDEQFDPREFAMSVSDVLTTEIMISVRITYSSVCEDVIGLRYALIEAKKAMRVLKLTGNDESVLGYASRGFSGMVAELSPEAADEFIKELYPDGKLPVLDEELKRAAESFLDNSLNISETARKLYMHRNTFIYQLDKIERLTGLNLRNFYDAMTYKLLVLAEGRLLMEN